MTGARLHPQVVAAFNAGVTSRAGEACPHLWSSDCFEAWEAGRALAAFSLCVEGLARRNRSYFVARLSDGREASARVCYGKAGAYQVEVNPPAASHTVRPIDWDAIAPARPLIGAGA